MIPVVVEVVVDVVVVAENETMKFKYMNADACGVNIQYE